MKISIIIPNYNGRKLLEKNLPAIIDVFEGNEIIIVDDCSADNSRDYIERFHKEIILIKNPVNRGFSYSVNCGVEKAKGDYILLLNTDVVPEKGLLQKLSKYFTDPYVFAVGCLEKNTLNGVISKCGRGIGKFNRGFLEHSKGRQDKKNTLWVSGGAGMFCRRIWITLGGFENLYNPFYWEDIDLSYRALKAGFKIIFEHQAEVNHYHEKGAIKTQYSASDIQTVAYKNQILFVWLNITDGRYVLQHLIFLPFHIIRSMIFSDLAFLKGFIQAGKSISKIVKERNRRKKFWKKSDREILSEFRI